MHYRWNDPKALRYMASRWDSHTRTGFNAVWMGDRTEAYPGNVETMSSNMRANGLSSGLTGGVQAEDDPAKAAERTAGLEAAYERWLDLFEAHLLEQPYLLGGTPSLADVNLMGSMHAHLFKDAAGE